MPTRSAQGALPAPQLQVPSLVSWSQPRGRRLVMLDGTLIGVSLTTHVLAS